MIIEIKVTPNAKTEKITFVDNQCKVYLTCQPEKGKANKRLIAILADYFSTKKHNISIIKGQNSRVKLVKIDDTDKLPMINTNTKKSPKFSDKNQKYLSRTHCWNR